MADLCARLNGGPLKNAEAVSSLSKEVNWALRTLETQQLRLASIPSFPSPVSSLPPELLALVFRFALQSSAKHPVPETPLCMSFAQVCRTWGSIALSLPSLWDTPLFDWPAFAELMLQRARDQPLIVKASIPDRALGKFEQRRIMIALEAAWQELPHVRHLELCGPANAVDDWISWLPSYTAASQLRMLSVEFDRFDDPGWQWSTDRLCYHFLLGTWWTGSQLSTRRGPTLCTHLVELTLTCTTRGVICTSLSDLLEILGQARALRVLTLSEVYDENQFDSPTLPFLDPPRLDHLRSVLLIGDLPLSATLLECLSLHEDSFIHLADGPIAKYWYSLPEDFAHAFTFLGKHASRLQDGPRTTALHIELFGCRLEVYSEVTDCQAPLFKLRGQWMAEEGEFGEEVLPELARALLLEDTRQLTATFDLKAEELSGSAWVGVFTYMNHLRSITLNLQAGFGFIAALNIAHRGVDSLPLPDLNTLVFSRMNLNLLMEEADLAGRRPTAIEVLTEVLINRAAGGRMHSVLSVRLQDCLIKAFTLWSERLESHSTHAQVTEVHTEAENAWGWNDETEEWELQDSQNQ
jgi:hypothetical protein